MERGRLDYLTVGEIANATYFANIRTDQAIKPGKSELSSNSTTSISAGGIS